MLKSLIQQTGLTISDDKFHQLERFVDLFVEKNKVINLTSITDEEEIWIKHIFDSLMVTKFLSIKPRMKIMDLGTGGGLPGIPLAIFYPRAEFVLVDSVEKKITAVEEFVDALELKNVTAICERAEVLGHDTFHRTTYDAVLTRAVAPLRILTELTIPLLKLHGSLFAYKGPDYITELTEARNAITKLKAEHPKVFHYKLPEEMGERTMIQITKKQPTPLQYPRRVGVPKKKPL